MKSQQAIETMKLKLNRMKEQLRRAEEDPGDSHIIAEQIMHYKMEIEALSIVIKSAEFFHKAINYSLSENFVTTRRYNSALEDFSVPIKIELTPKQAEEIGITNVDEIIQSERQSKSEL